MPPAPTASTPHVLVVDDEPEVRAMIAALLTEQGLRTTEAGGVAEALKAVTAHRFDAAVVDLAMSGTSGFVLLAQFRGLGNGRGLPTVLLSSLPRGDSRDAAKAQAARFASVEFLDKPVTGRRLAAALTALLALA